MQRKLLLLAVVVLSFLSLDAFAVCRTDVASGYGVDVSTLKLGGTGLPDANANLFDYGVIFEDSNNSTCAGTASIALYKKVKATLAFPSYFDGNVNRTVTPYNGWLEGANVGLVYASALALGGQGKLTRPLALLVDSIVYNGWIDAYCGFASNRAGQTGVWTSQNSCMDDNAVAAHGLAWKAAWQGKWANYPFPYDAAAKTAISRALNTTESVCLHKDTAPPANPVTSSGPCTATVAEVNSGAAVAMGLHNGDAMPYGIGLMTSIASAHVALDTIGQTVNYTSDELSIAKALYKNADKHTYYDPTAAYTFDSTCYTFSKSGTALVRSATFQCWEPGYGDGKTSGYQPEMFPVKEYYDWKLGGAPATTNFNFSGAYFNNSLFCDTPGACTFFGPGRKAVYKTLAYDWIWSRPYLTATTSDYTTSFKTYDNAHYLSARNGGGSDVNAEPTTAGTNETFSMVDVNGGWLTSGDVVYLQVANGKYVSATNGGGSSVVAQFDTPVTWERFTIEKMNGTGQIYTGDTVALKVLNGQYISAVNGGGSNTVAMYTSPITWEVFTISYVH